jgi:digeranylgeranylglycerophospholipid reductase
MNQLAAADVLVVGLGPAGASAAAAAAKAGLRVVAIDRRAQAGTPVQCAEFVPLALCEGVMAERQPIAAMRTMVEDDTPDLTESFSGRMIDRADFDAALVARAQASGADCLFATALACLAPDGKARLTDGTNIEARLVIGADGPRSRVGAAIGSSNAELVETRQLTVPLAAPHQATDIFLSAEMVGGYGWLFPKNNVANLGVGVAASARHRLKPLLETLRQRLITEGRIGEAVLGHTGGAIPVGGMIPACGMLDARAVLLAGDAAGLVNPVTGAGIAAAVISGRMAGEAAAAWLSGDGGALEDYAEQLEDYFGPALGRALKRRRELLARYEDEGPGRADLRRGWIAYPQYWERIVSDDMPQA